MVDAILSTASFTFPTLLDSSLVTSFRSFESVRIFSEFSSVALAVFRTPSICLARVSYIHERSCLIALCNVLASACTAMLPAFFFLLSLVSLMNFRIPSRSTLVVFSIFSLAMTSLSTLVMSWSVMDFCLLLLGVPLLASADLLLAALDVLLCCVAVFVLAAVWVAALVWYELPGGIFIVGVLGLSMPPLSGGSDILSMFVYRGCLFNDLLCFRGCRDVLCEGF